MTHYMTTACILLAAVAAVAALFIRRAVLYRRRLHRAEAAPQPQPRPERAVRDDGYRARYVLTRRGGTFRSGKTVRIRPEYYERLRRITARSGAVSMIAYVDNVLHAHFEDYGESIDRCCHGRKPSQGKK